MNQSCYKIRSMINTFFRNTTGNALPLVLFIALIVMLVGGSVAYSTTQMYKVTRDGFHEQLTYLAAENALERCFANLESIITLPDYSGSQGVSFSGNTDSFLDDLVDALNSDTNIVKSYTIDMNDTFNSAEASVRFDRYDDSTYVNNGDTITFPLVVTATASMEDAAFRTYNKQVVAVKEFTVYIYSKFSLNGAVYSLGDVVVRRGNDVSTDYSTIQGDIYAFGTGLDKTNRMQQHYLGGVCAIEDSILHVENGSIFTRNLVRTGTFEDSDGGSASIIVDEDIVAQGIQVFGSDDNIVVIRDAYTFDDIEMNGPNSIIAVNRNFFGLNGGNGREHDASSAILNVVPMYGSTSSYKESRIVVNGDIFANGVTFRTEVSGGLVGHKLESVAMTWMDNEPLHIKKGIPHDADDSDYVNILYNPGPGEVRNGFSVLWKTVWDPDGDGKSIDMSTWTKWQAWLSAIRNAASGMSNSFNSEFLVPGSINMTGFCRYGIAANNSFYKFVEEEFDKTHTSTVTVDVVDKVDTLDSSEKYILRVDPSYWSDPAAWYTYTDDSEGIPVKLNYLMNHLIGHVQVFASKSIDENDYRYDYVYSSPSQTEFNRIKEELADKFINIPTHCVLRYDDDLLDSSGTTIDINAELETKFDNVTGESYNDFHFLVLNFDPDNVIKVTKKFDGIIFSTGKVIVGKDGEVNGAIIAAGRGFDDHDGLKGSAADIYYEGSEKKTRLPRVYIPENVGDLDTRDEFNSWEYAAVEIENGGDIRFDSAHALLTRLKNQSGRSIDLFEIFNVEVSP